MCSLCKLFEVVTNRFLSFGRWHYNFPFMDFVDNNLSPLSSLMDDIISSQSVLRLRCGQ